MILNVGLRTDIVNHYSDWLFRRFREGFVYSRNPLFPMRVNSYDLSPDEIDAVSFCSKNYTPVMSRLHEITDRFRTYFFYTVTAYEEDLEPNIPPIEESVRTLKELSKLVGREKLAWRYDPVLLTSKYTAERHFETFERLCEEISPYVSKCIFSFVEMFVSIEKNIKDLIPLKSESKHFLARGFAKIAEKYDLPLQICCAENGFDVYGIKQEGCLTLETLGEVNNCRFRSVKHTGNKAGCRCILSRDIGWYDSCPSKCLYCRFRSVKHTGNKAGCRCILSRDIGWYDSCPSKCLYCNANRGLEDVQENFERHDPYSPLLIGHLKKEDTLLKGVQTSFLLHDGKQLSLFDI